MDVSSLDTEFPRLAFIAAAIAFNLHVLAASRWRRGDLAAFGGVCAASACLAVLLGIADAFIRSSAAFARGGPVTAATVGDVVGFLIGAAMFGALVAGLVGLPFALFRWVRQRRQRFGWRGWLRWRRPTPFGVAATFFGVPIAAYIAFLLAVTFGPLLSGQQYVGPARVAFDVARDGRSVVYSHTDGRLYRVDLATGRSRPLTVPLTGDAAARQLVDPAFSPDGSLLACGGANGLTLLTAEGRIVRRMAVGDAYAAFDPCFSPDGRRIVFVRARNNPSSPTGVWWVDYDLWLVNVDGTGLRRLTDKRYLPARRPRFLPDGLTVVYSAASRGGVGDDAVTESLYVVRVDGARPAAGPGPYRAVPVRADGTPAYSESPSVSPDGKRIAFVCDVAASYAYDVCVEGRGDLANRDAAHVRGLHLTGASDVECRSPVWTPDGKQLLYLDGLRLMRMDADGRNRHGVASL
jgi:Tol biopolymer transport system component